MAVEPSTSQKKPFKPQLWMVGALIVPFGLFMIARGVLKMNSVELGGECGQRDECKAPADSCLSLNGRSVCSKFCSGDCPNGLSCVTIDISMKTGSGFNAIPNQQVCLPADMIKR
jgi:hypothetical protein